LLQKFWVYVVIAWSCAKLDKFKSIEKFVSGKGSRGVGVFKLAKFVPAITDGRRTGRYGRKHWQKPEYASFDFEAHEMSHQVQVEDRLGDEG